MCVPTCARVRVCVHVHAYACVWERETERIDREREREFCPLSGFRYTGTLIPVPVYRTEATRIGALGITAAYRQPYVLPSANLLLQNSFPVRSDKEWSDNVCVHFQSESSHTIYRVSNTEVVWQWIVWSGDTWGWRTALEYLESFPVRSLKPLPFVKAAYVM